MKRSILSLISVLPLSFAACGGGDTGGDCTPTAGTNTAKFVADTLKVPAQRTDYAFDLTGSGRMENQLGIIMGALQQQNLMPQMGVDQAIASGQVVLLLSETSSDATFQSDSCAKATVQNGVSGKAAPMAGATYMVDSSSTGGTFAGPIAGGKFNSSAPATTKMPVTVSLQLPLVPMSDPLKLNVVGAHITFNTDSTGKKIPSGQINGAIKATDVNNQIIPKVAELLQNKLAMDKANPTSTDMSILTLFDTGGNATSGPADGCSSNTCGSACQNPMSAKQNACMCAKASDGFVDLCEVATNSIIKSVLAPDVQMFDASGNYAPNPTPTATSKDSLSLGLGFTAINATF